MGMPSQAQWSGLGFAPFSCPELPLAIGGREGLFVTEWATGVTDGDNRRTPRRSVQCDLVMTDPGWWDTSDPFAIHGQCRNISDDGLYAVVPVGLRLAVGQRYWFRLYSVDGGEHLSEHGTIIRTEPLLGQDADQVGIGVRLCGSHG